MSKYILLFSSIACTVCAQLLFKFASSSIQLTAGQPIYTQLIKFTPLFVGYILFFISSILWIFALKLLPLSTAYPIAGISYVFVLLGSSLIFHEQITAVHVIGTFMIVFGVSLIAMRS